MIFWLFILTSDVDLKSKKWNRLSFCTGTYFCNYSSIVSRVVLMQMQQCGRLHIFCRAATEEKIRQAYESDSVMDLLCMKWPNMMLKQFNYLHHITIKLDLKLQEKFCSNKISLQFLHSWGIFYLLYSIFAMLRWTCT